jgi:hypothetical protein
MTGIVSMVFLRKTASGTIVWNAETTKKVVFLLAGEEYSQIHGMGKDFHLLRICPTG